ncbi:hypothetical protein QOT17_007702 [Balamuthia mandrillaris]
MSIEEAVPTYALGALVAGGGIMGFKKARSWPSLISGLGFGTLFVLSGELMRKPESATTGKVTSFASSILLTSAMYQRFNKTRALFPAGAMCGLGVVATVYHGNLFFPEGQGLRYLAGKARRDGRLEEVRLEAPRTHRLDAKHKERAREELEENELAMEEVDEEAERAMRSHEKLVANRLSPSSSTTSSHFTSSSAPHPKEVATSQDDDEEEDASSPSTSSTTVATTITTDAQKNDDNKEEDEEEDD